MLASSCPSWCQPLACGLLTCNAPTDPCYDMGGGERLLKDIYEALRAGPGWNSTLLWVGYDDAGGFYDHVIPPFEGVPSPDHPCHVAPVCKPAPPAVGWQGSPPCLRPPCTNGSSTTNYSLTAKFDFRRLGMRSAAMLISPYVAAGSVFQTPRGTSLLLLLLLLLLWSTLMHALFPAAVSWTK